MVLDVGIECILMAEGLVFKERQIAIDVIFAGTDKVAQSTQVGNLGGRNVAQAEYAGRASRVILRRIITHNQALFNAVGNDAIEV